MHSHCVLTAVIGCSVLSVTLSGLYIWNTGIGNQFHGFLLLQDQGAVLHAIQRGHVFRGQYEYPNNDAITSSPADMTWDTTSAPWDLTSPTSKKRLADSELSLTIVSNPDQSSLTTSGTVSNQAKDEVPSEIKYGASSYAGFEPLPKSVIDGVKTFVYFIGHARSGHSIVGSVLDGHPHIVISHESKIFKRLIKIPYAANKSYIYNTIWSSAFLSANTGIRTAGANGKGYTLAVNGLYQGTYESYIDVIGEKKGDLTTEMFLYSPTQLKKVIDKLNTALGLPLKVFHVIRNPFDNIATTVLYDNFRDSQIGKAKRYKGVYAFNTSLVDKEIEKYFRYYQGIENAKKMFRFDLMVIHGKDFVADPRTMIIKMCNFLEVHCSDNYLDISSKKIFSSESKTRHKIKWEGYQILRVQSYIKKFSNLKRYYDFN